jgi:hypothetical protein
MKKYDHLYEEIQKLHDKGVRPTVIYKSLNIPKSSYLHIREKLNLESRAYISESICLDDIMEYLIGTVMGDSHIPKGSSIATIISFAHAEQYEEFFNYKIKVLGFKGSKLHQNCFDKRRNKKSKRYSYASNNIKELKYVREKFYPEGIKVIPMDIIEKYFTEKSLAWLFMDDGSSQDYNTIICLQGFKKDNLKEFVDFLYRKFDIEFTIQSGGAIRLKQHSMSKFYNLISDEINKVECMKYKIAHMQKYDNIIVQLNGKDYSISELAIKFKISHHKLYSRIISYKWSVEDAISNKYNTRGERRKRTKL